MMRNSFSQLSSHKVEIHPFLKLVFVAAGVYRDRKMTRLGKTAILVWNWLYFSTLSFVVVYVEFFMKEESIWLSILLSIPYLTMLVTWFLLILFFTQKMEKWLSIVDERDLDKFYLSTRNMGIVGVSLMVITFFLYVYSLTHAPELNHSGARETFVAVFYPITGLIGFFVIFSVIAVLQICVFPIEQDFERFLTLVDETFEHRMIDGDVAQLSVYSKLASPDIVTVRANASAHGFQVANASTSTSSTNNGGLFAGTSIQSNDHVRPISAQINSNDNEDEDENGNNHHHHHHDHRIEIEDKFTDIHKIKIQSAHLNNKIDKFLLERRMMQMNNNSFNNSSYTSTHIHRNLFDSDNNIMMDTNRNSSSSSSSNANLRHIPVNNLVNDRDEERESSREELEMDSYHIIGNYRTCYWVLLGHSRLLEAFQHFVQDTSAIINTLLFIILIFIIALTVNAIQHYDLFAFWVIFLIIFLLALFAYLAYISTFIRRSERRIRRAIATSTAGIKDNSRAVLDLHLFSSRQSSGYTILDNLITPSLVAKLAYAFFTLAMLWIRYVVIETT